MAITINGDTGISSIGALSGVTSVSSAAADTPVILQDSSSNSNTCRAWVNFNGTGTVAIRADFNVSSITDNGGNGNYNVNFANNMPDANYSVTASHSIDFVLRVDSYATSTFRVVCNATTTDAGTVSVAVFR